MCGRRARQLTDKRSKRTAPPAQVGCVVCPPTVQAVKLAALGHKGPAEAGQRRADAIVMAADAPQHWLIANMAWSQEPQRVCRLAPVPVYLVIETARDLAR